MFFRGNYCTSRKVTFPSPQRRQNSSGEERSRTTYTQFKRVVCAGPGRVRPGDGIWELEDGTAVHHISIDSIVRAQTEFANCSEYFSSSSAGTVQISQLPRSTWPAAPTTAEPPPSWYYCGA